MRFLLYNMRYATGPKMHNYMNPTRRNLERITHFLKELQPDVAGLIEVDHGSYRSNGKNQAEQMAEALGHYHTHSIKYGQNSLWRHIPVLKKQGNAFLARDRIRNETFHYFQRGVKKLVIELELEHVVVYLVHLSLGARTRHHQLRDLYTMVKNTEKPCIVAGDFNMLWGEDEIDLFLAATGLKNANTGNLPTFPSNRPRRHLDFVLHSKEITVKDFQVPKVTFSDHLPVIVDFDVQVKEDHRAQQRDTHCFCLLSTGQASGTAA